MSGWRDAILNAFPGHVFPLTLVADPDGLLVEEGIQEALRERGFEVLVYDDPVAFRYIYESRYRSLWDAGQSSEHALVVRSDEEDLHALPYDLLQRGRSLRFSLADLFPSLNYGVVAALDTQHWDALYQSQQDYHPGELGERATRTFILKHVFDTDPELIKTPADLLHTLLKRHYRGQRVPRDVDQPFLQALRRRDVFKGWPLEQIATDRDAFFRFLQERWPRYIRELIRERANETYEPLPSLILPGPSSLPYGHEDVRIYIDNLFLEGFLHPIDHRNADLLEGAWAAVGLDIDPDRDRLRRFEKLVEKLEGSIPEADAQHQHWLTFAHRWAEGIALRHLIDLSKHSNLHTRLMALQHNVDAAFAAWVQRRYDGLHNQPALPPVMLHHVPRFLAHHLEQSPTEKVALVLLDGLALDQWIVLRDILSPQVPDLRFREEAVFAWLPTLTSVSRQAAFAARLPAYFPDSIHTTAKDSDHWRQFWVNRGYHAPAARYANVVGDAADLDRIHEMVSDPRVHILGLVVQKVDKIMHGMELGARGMHDQVRLWAQQGFPARLLELLQDHGYDVFLTSDHGNIEATGCGSPKEGMIASERGQRVRVFESQTLRAQVDQRYPEAISWTSRGLPPGYETLFAPSRGAFISEGKKTVTHGGISVEEVIVPFIHVTTG